MDKHSNGTATASLAGITSFLLAAILLAGASAQAQQQSKLTASYSKAARAALSAIESDTSAPQDQNSEDMEIATTQAIDNADGKATSRQEKALTEMLRQIYQLKRNDNTVLRAYGILMEVDNTPAASDNPETRRRKDLAVSQFADGQVAITDREDTCFKQLEQSLAQRSADATGCSQWIEKAKTSDKNPSKTAQTITFDPAL
jgi:hypothetical protein